MKRYLLALAIVAFAGAAFASDTDDLCVSDSKARVYAFSDDNRGYTARWNAIKRTRLENRLTSMVRNGEISLSVAQSMVAADWTGAYQKFVESN